MKVKANKGLLVPKEGIPRQYITDSTVVDVPSSSYYNRLLRDGSLVLAEETPPSRPATSPAQLNKKGGKQ